MPVLTSTPPPLLARRAWALAAVAGAAFAVGALAGAVHRPGERDVVERYARAWEHGDYAALHRLLTVEVQRRVTPALLADAYRAANMTATATAVEVGRPRERDGHWTLPVVVRTRAFGTVRGAVTLPLEGSGDAARVAWRGYLTFPGLEPGERLERQTELPARAALLAADRTPLAAGAERSSPLGEVARAAVGQLGPAPAERQARLRALGYPEQATVGLSGLERIFDERLGGRPGGRLLAGGRVLAQRRPRAGEAVRTTISPAVQRAALAALAGRLGGVVALRPRTGEILAFAGIPFSGLQPPGSTFKIITLAAALEHGLAGPRSSYPYATEATLSGVKLANANGESCGGPLALAFAISCNSVFAPLGVRVGAPRLVAMAERFGFNRPPGIPGAATSLIPAAADIGDDLALGSTAIGQGRVQATTLQMAIVAATIALEGRRPGLTLDADRPAAPRDRAVPARVARRVGRLMVDVVRRGTGRLAALPGVAVAGKTGTAELRTTHPCAPDPANPESCPPQDRANDPTDTDAWFAAFAPATAPRVVVAVLLVQSGAGGDTAAPAARGVLQAALS